MKVTEFFYVLFEHGAAVRYIEPIFLSVKKQQAIMEEDRQPYFICLRENGRFRRC